MKSALTFFCACLFTFTVITVKGQTVLFNNNFGEPGNGVKVRKYLEYMPIDVNAYLFAHPDIPNIAGKSYSEAKAIENSFYAIVGPKYLYSSVGLPNTALESWNQWEGIYRIWDGLVALGDATPGHNGDGGALVINAGAALATFYERLALLESGKYYKLSYELYVENPDVKIMHCVVQPQKNTSVATYETPGNGQGSKKWKKQECWYYMPPSCPSGNFLILLQNSIMNDYGNDFAIDDILFEDWGTVKPAGVPVKSINTINCGLVYPEAVDDEKLNQPYGNVMIPILANDRLLDGGQATTSNLTVEFLKPMGASAAPQYDAGIIVPGEGKWKYDAYNPGVYHDVTFIPLAEFKGNPTPLQYVIKDKVKGVSSNRGSIRVTYAGHPVAFNDTVTMTQGQQKVNIRVLENDKKGNNQTPSAAEVVLKLTDPYNPFSKENSSLTIAGEGVWSYQAGILSFTPVAGFSKTPTMVKYRIAVDGLYSNPATVRINRSLLPARNYWVGAVDTDWSKAENWTLLKMPERGDDIEFATAANNGGSPAVSNLHLDADRLIGNLTNSSDKDLVVTSGNQLTVSGTVTDENIASGTIVIKSESGKPSGTLYFVNSNLNSSVKAVVEFYNKAFECQECGFYKKVWQYFGIPVRFSDFPYQNPVGETVNQWVEPYNGDKWRPAPYSTSLQLESFRGYQITSSSATLPSHVYRFSGILNVGTTAVDVTRTVGVNYPGMNLIANSFTAAIPVTPEAISFTGVWDEVVYLFNSGTRDEWKKVNGSIETSGTKAGQYTAVPLRLAGQIMTDPFVIPSMHAFMINAQSGGKLTINYNELVKNKSMDSVSWRSYSSDEKLPYIALDVIGSKSADRVWIFENGMTTRGFDAGWDGNKIEEKDLLQVYVSEEELKYQVSTVPELTGTKIGLQTDHETDYVLSFSVSSDVEARDLFLYDRVVGKYYSIHNNAEYTVKGVNTDVNSRFKIVSSLNRNEVEKYLAPIEVGVRNRAIYVVNSSDEDCIVAVFDVAGKKLIEKLVKQFSNNAVTSSGTLQNGIYIVRVYGKKKVNEVRKVRIF